MAVVPEIHLKYTSRIWNIYTAADKFLLLEIRDEETLSTSFDLFDITSKSYQWQNQMAEEAWHIGVSFFSEDLIVFHVFENGPLPGIAKLLVYRTVSGKVINEITDLQPYAFSGELVKGADSKGDVKLLDLATGDEVLKNFSMESVINSLRLPLTYTEGSDNFLPVKDYVAHYFNEDATGVAEYLEYDEMIFLSYHINEKNFLSNWLVVINSEGKVWLKERIATGEKFFSDTFFIWQDYLVFIIGQQELKALKIKRA